MDTGLLMSMLGVIHRDRTSMFPPRQAAYTKQLITSDSRGSPEIDTHYLSASEKLRWNWSLCSVDAHFTNLKVSINVCISLDWGLLSLWAAITSKGICLATTTIIQAIRLRCLFWAYKMVIFIIRWSDYYQYFDWCNCWLWNIEIRHILFFKIKMVQNSFLKK